MAHIRVTSLPGESLSGDESFFRVEFSGGTQLVRVTNIPSSWVVEVWTVNGWQEFLTLNKSYEDADEVAELVGLFFATR